MCENEPQTNSEIRTDIIPSGKLLVGTWLLYKKTTITLKFFSVKKIFQLHFKVKLGRRMYPDDL